MNDIHHCGRCDQVIRDGQPTTWEPPRLLPGGKGEMQVYRVHTDPKDCAKKVTGEG